MQLKWIIINRVEGEFKVLKETDLPPRPRSARDDKGDPFTPWYKEVPHFHYDNPNDPKKVTGVHGFGTVESVFRALIMKQAEG